MRSSFRILRILLFLAIAATATVDAAKDAPAEPSPFAALNTPHLHNAHRVTDKVIAGAQPEGEESFRTLAALGVKTIISVDGARPDVQIATKHGMSYVHLPIGYDSVGHDEGLALARAMAELPGPIYVHCHHGRHRSAAAVAVACVQNGSLKPQLAESVLATFGTGRNYLGLWKSAREARPLDASVLRRVQVEYRQIAPIPPLAEAMVQVDQHLEHLRQLQKRDWLPPPDHPDLDARHEALQLHERLTELARGQAAEGRPPEYHKLLAESQAATLALREALGASPIPAAHAGAAMTRVGRSCTACHARFRD